VTEQLFTKRTYTIYKHQVARFAEKRNKKDKVTRVARPIPYTLAEFRAWVTAQFKGGPQWVTKCAYCEGKITLLTFCVDHDVPVGRGGSLGLANLAMCCQRCNNTKGQMTGRAFRQFMAGLATFPEADRNDVLKRLKMGGGGFRFMAGKTAEAKIG
jgi:5-methylcytosine-specific restriction endonuclease McrA